jgi:hypothetical protein
MIFQTVAKAVKLKNLIDNAHEYLPRIGRCLSLELEYKRMHIECEGDEIEEEEEPINPKMKRRWMEEAQKWKLQKLQDNLAKIYEFAGCRMKRDGFEDSSIEVLGQKIQSLKDISKEDIQKWYATGVDSGFGNVIKQETQHDTQVRASRELDVSQFTVSQELLDNIALKWGEVFVPSSVNLIADDVVLSRYGQKFIPESVMVQPYKIVIYGPGDHFRPHRDTPEKNLCGTFLISLFEDCNPRNVFEISEHGEYNSWSSYRGNGWCAFYPDIPHRVKSLDSGYRAILSFKLFSKKFEPPVEWSMNAATRIKLDDFAKDIQNLQVPVGILCRHHYGYDSESIYGPDKLLLDAFKSKGLRVEMKPVLIHLFGKGPEPMYGNPPGEVSSQVFSITDEELDYVHRCLSGEKENPKFAKSDKDIVFLDGQRRGCIGLWEYDEEESIEHTGNESQPHSENSVYVRYAAIVTPKDCVVGGMTLDSS